MSTEATVRVSTRNQLVIDYERKVLLVGTYTTDRRDYANISGAIETVEVGTVMGIVAATGKLVPFDSTAVDGSQNPVFVAIDELQEVAIAGTVDSVVVANGGEINQGLLKFQNGTDTLETTVAIGGVTKSVKDWLTTNGNNYEFLTVKDTSKFSNQ